MPWIPGNASAVPSTSVITEAIKSQAMMLQRQSTALNTPPSETREVESKRSGDERAPNTSDAEPLFEGFVHGHRERSRSTSDARTVASIRALLNQAVESLPSYIENSACMLVLAPPQHHNDRRSSAGNHGETLSYSTWRGRGWCRTEYMAAMMSRSKMRTLVIKGPEADPELVVTEAPNVTMHDSFNLIPGLGKFTCTSSEESCARPSPPSTPRCWRAWRSVHFPMVSIHFIVQSSARGGVVCARFPVDGDGCSCDVCVPRRPLAACTHVTMARSQLLWLCWRPYFVCPRTYAFPFRRPPPRITPPLALRQVAPATTTSETGRTLCHATS